MNILLINHYAGLFILTFAMYIRGILFSREESCGYTICTKRHDLLLRDKF